MCLKPPRLERFNWTCHLPMHTDPFKFFRQASQNFGVINSNDNNFYSRLRQSTRYHDHSRNRQQGCFVAADNAL